MSSQAGQDRFVLSLINKGTFLDIGCYHPAKFNNTILLEQAGWTGTAIDIVDYSNMWESRRTKFIWADALQYDFTKLPELIDYLSLDVEGNGDRYAVLERVIKNRTFKIITIEHDIYRGYNKTEAEPQRRLLTDLGYDLVCKNVKADTRPFEDWWVHPDYVEGYEMYRSIGLHYTEILKR